MLSRSHNYVPKALPRLTQLVAGPSPQNPGSTPRPSQCGIYGGQRSIKTCFIRIGLFPFSPVSVIQKMRHAHSFVYHRLSIFSEIDSVFK
jgi:hypothetical protein